MSFGANDLVSVRLDRGDPVQRGQFRSRNVHSRTHRCGAGPALPSRRHPPARDRAVTRLGPRVVDQSTVAHGTDVVDVPTAPMPGDLDPGVRESGVVQAVGEQLPPGRSLATRRHRFRVRGFVDRCVRLVNRQPGAHEPGGTDRWPGAVARTHDRSSMSRGSRRPGLRPTSTAGARSRLHPRSALPVATAE